MPRCMAQTKRTLAPALARNAARTAARSQRTDLAEARELVALIRRRKAEVQEAFYDIGEALTKLAQPRLFGALRCSSFRELVEQQLELTMVTARRLMEIPKQLTRKRALALGQRKATALIALAAATPEPDTAEQLARTSVRTRGRHQAVVPSKLSSREIERLAVVERRSHAKKDPAAATLARAAAWAEKATKALGAPAKIEVCRTRRKGVAEAIELRIACSLEQRAALAEVLQTYPRG